MIAVFLFVAASSEPTLSADASSAPVAKPVPFLRDVRVDIGMKGTMPVTPSSDAFGLPSFVSQGTFGVSWALLSVRRFSFAPGARYEPSFTKGVIEGAQFSQSAHRLLLTLEARYRPLTWLEVSARGAAGAQLSHVSVSAGPLVSEGGTAAATADASGAVAFLLGPHKHPETRRVRVWLTLEGGYSFAGRAVATLTPVLGEADTRATGSVTVAQPTLQGPFVRSSVALAF